jgi:hypothetical protein
LKIHPTTARHIRKNPKVAAKQHQQHHAVAKLRFNPQES